ncbi:MAG TPA: hypothetical protein VED46_04140 [Alphaproteobacteria bacterium]|nr:hypothetical protein [Alphaproteobacteria bacterium]
MASAGEMSVAVARESRSPRRRRDDRTPRQIGGWPLAGVAGLGLAMIVMAVPRIVSGAFIFPHEPVMRLIQRGADVPIHLLVEARRGYEAAIVWHGGANERSALAILRFRLALALGVATPGGRAVLESAREAAREALIGTPADPYLWAQLAEAERMLEGPGPGFVAALMRSIATGPFEPSLTPFRAAMGLESWAQLQTTEREQIAEQVRVAAVLEPDRLRRAVTDPLRLRIVAEILEGRPELYARFRANVR